MSTSATRPPDSPLHERTVAEPISGWSMLASVLLLIGGSINFLHGVTALNNSEFLVNQLLYDDLDVWGWVFIVIGALQVLAGALTVSRSAGMFGIGLGVTLASIAIVAWFFMIFAAPFAAIVGIALNTMIVSGLMMRVPESDY